MKLTAKLLPNEIEFLTLCRRAGQFGGVVPCDLKLAMTLAGMGLIEQVSETSFSLTDAGRRALAEQEGK